ncbi:MAG: hypothetical protein ABFS42_03540 [Candidatus Krumholzibacteriota bacterium]
MKALMITAAIPLALAMAGCTDTTAPTAPAPELPLIDTAPPAIPTGLWATPTERYSVKLAWDPNTTDWDIKGYLVYRLAFGHVYPLTTEPTSEPRYVDKDPLDGPCLYAVTSIDEAGNESGWIQIRYNFEREDAVPRAE